MNRHLRLVPELPAPATEKTAAKKTVKAKPAKAKGKR